MSSSMYSIFPEFRPSESHCHEELRGLPPAAMLITLSRRGSVPRGVERIAFFVQAVVAAYLGTTGKINALA
jgi:hypothetical protein